jgi:hypothetical protein
MADAREVGQRFIEAFNAHDKERIRELNEAVSRSGGKTTLPD